MQQCDLAILAGVLAERVLRPMVDKVNSQTIALQKSVDKTNDQNIFAYARWRDYRESINMRLLEVLNTLQTEQSPLVEGFNDCYCMRLLSLAFRALKRSTIDDLGALECVVFSYILRYPDGVYLQILQERRRTEFRGLCHRATSAKVRFAPERNTIKIIPSRDAPAAKRQR